MLRLVHPAPNSNGPTCPKGRKSPALVPTPEEQKRIYTAIRNIARAYGGVDVLASVMGVHYSRLVGHQTRSFAVAVLLARAANIPVEQILSGQPHEAGACAVCGRKGAR